MRISELTSKTGLSYSTDAANSYLVMNYLGQNEETPVTYKIDLSELKSGLALNNVDNVSDANKPISTAAQAALDLKANTADLNTTITGMGAGKTLSALSETNGVISASFQNIEITSSQISDKSDAIDSTSSNVATAKAVKDSLDAAKSDSTSKINGLNVSDITSNLSVSKTITALSESAGKISATASNIQIAQSQVTDLPTALNNKLETSLKGAASGLAELDANGHVPAAQLPSYVDDILEGTLSTFPSPGETGKIYVDTATNTSYRWSGSQYTKVASDLSLGETSSTAYRGDYGAAAYAHAVTNKGSAYASGLYKITTNSEGHVTAATAVEKSDITALGVYEKPSTGIPASDIAEGVIPDISIDEPEFTTSITIGSTTLTEAQLQTLLLFDDFIDNFDLKLALPTSVTWNYTYDTLTATPNVYASTTTIIVQEQNGNDWITYTGGARVSGTHYRAYGTRSVSFNSKTYTSEGVIGEEFVAPTYHTITVNHQDENHETLYNSTSNYYEVNEHYHITPARQLVAQNVYLAEPLEFDGQMGDSDLNLTFIYTLNPATYTLTVNHINIMDNSNLLEPQVTSGFAPGANYSTTSQQIPNYTLVEYDGIPAGTFSDSDIVVTYKYAPRD